MFSATLQRDDVAKEACLVGRHRFDKLRFQSDLAFGLDGLNELINAGKTVQFGDGSKSRLDQISFACIQFDRRTVSHSRADPGDRVWC